MSEHQEQIPFVDLVGQFRRYEDELREAIDTVVHKAAFIGGPHVRSFESAFSAFCGVEHTIGVGNGTDALYLAMRALGIGPGDEVITAANSFIASSEAISMAGARPVFADVDPETALIDLESVERALTPKTKALLPVHLFGQLCDMQGIFDLAEANQLMVIEDAAQAHGAEQNGKRAGSFGRAGCFSFYPGKNLGAYGDAGAVVTNDPALAEKVRRLANHGRTEKYGHQIEGVNSRLDGLQAAILNVKLRHLETMTNERRDAAKRYREMLADMPQVRPLALNDERGHVHHLFVVRVPERDRLRGALAEQNIQSGVHYPTPLHRLPAYEHLNYGEGSFPVAEALCRDILSLPISPEITGEQQERVVQVVRAHVGAMS